jgi:hypothetical protein
MARERVTAKTRELGHKGVVSNRHGDVFGERRRSQQSRTSAAQTARRWCKPTAASERRVIPLWHCLMAASPVVRPTDRREGGERCGISLYPPAVKEQLARFAARGGEKSAFSRP